MEHVEHFVSWYGSAWTHSYLHTVHSMPSADRVAVNSSCNADACEDHTYVR
jgi:hypothetical protein